MKKIIILIISFVLLSGCNNKKEDSISIICPTGAPAIAFYDEVENEEFETNSVPSDIVAIMASNAQKDIVVIDTITGISAIKKGANYSLAAILTFGNFYIASTGNDDNNILDSNDYVVLFGQNQAPDVLFKYLYGDGYHHVLFENNVQDAARDLIMGTDLNGEKVDYVFIAEPALTSAMHKNPNIKVYANIQDKYKEKTGSYMIQAGLFVNNNTSKEKIDSYLKNLETNVNALINDSNELNNKFINMSDDLISTKYGIDLNTMTSALINNSIGLGYENALSIKENIDEYLLLMNKDITNEEIYFK